MCQRRLACERKRQQATERDRRAPSGQFLHTHLQLHIMGQHCKPVHSIPSSLSLLCFFSTRGVDEEKEARKGACVAALSTPEKDGGVCRFSREAWKVFESRKVEKIDKLKYMIGQQL